MDVKNQENSFATKVSQHIASDVSMSTISSFRNIDNRHGENIGKDVMKI